MTMVDSVSMLPNYELYAATLLSSTILVIPLKFSNGDIPCCNMTGPKSLPSGADTSALEFCGNISST